MSTPHALHDEFPDDAELIHALKTSDTHFARLMTEYDEINDKVHNAETFVKPTTPEHESELRKQRLALKDQIAHAIAAAKEAQS